jgi:hypothetical protein
VDFFGVGVVAFFGATLGLTSTLGLGLISGSGVGEEESRSMGFYCQLRHSGRFSLLMKSVSMSKV